MRPTPVSDSDQITMPEPRTPRMERGTKVVLPSGEVRLITATEFDYNKAGVTTGIKLLFSDRWSPRVG